MSKLRDNIESRERQLGRDLRLSVRAVLWLSQLEEEIFRNEEEEEEQYDQY